MTNEIENKIQQLLDSEAINYLETSERLILKNILEKESISELEFVNLEKIIEIELTNEERENFNKSVKAVMDLFEVAKKIDKSL